MTTFVMGTAVYPKSGIPASQLKWMIVSQQQYFLYVNATLVLWMVEEIYHNI